jgi:hypothetical protein
MMSVQNHFLLRSAPLPGCGNVGRFALIQNRRPINAAPFLTRTDMSETDFLISLMCIGILTRDDHHIPKIENGSGHLLPLHPWQQGFGTHIMVNQRTPIAALRHIWQRSMQQIAVEEDNRSRFKLYGNASSSR